MSDDLYDRRLDVAKATKGTSSSTIYHLLADLASQTIARDAAILEFGAGTGSLLKMLRAGGFHGKLTAADILPRPDNLDASTCWIEGDLNNPLPLPSASFDAIISTEVIEHLENPRAVFREFGRLSRAGGLVLLTTPNQESVRSLLSLVFRGHFVDFLDSSYPLHITPLLRQDLMHLCAENGFDPPEFRYTGQGSLPAAPRVTWQRVSGGFLKGRLFSDTVAMIARRRSG